MSEMKKRLQRKGARKGFTLVELLIVIIIIGILAGAMMMVAGGGRDAAEASKIVSDLRTIKSAALMWMTENPAGDAKELWNKLNNDPTPLNAYLDRPLLAGQDKFVFEKDGKLIINILNEGDELEPKEVDALLLGYKLGDETTSYVRSGVRTNLAKQAESAGLYGGKKIDLTGTSQDPEAVGFYTDDKNIVYVIVQ
jgi:prepilin-type N-terminal cleavage/methylation domain-containing protein